jgi:hypothetical protein
MADADSDRGIRLLGIIRAADCNRPRGWNGSQLSLKGRDDGIVEDRDVH